jgi:hypothetical protein
MDIEETNTETPFKIKCEILAEMFVSDKDDEDLQDLFAYGDLGFPLAYCIANGIVKKTKKAKKLIEEVFDLTISSFGLEDEGFTDYEDLMLSIELYGYSGDEDE